MKCEDRTKEKIKHFLDFIIELLLFIDEIKERID